MKKVLAAVLITAMLCPLGITMPVSAERFETYEEYAVCLTELGCADYTGEAEIDSIVTREQFCEIIVKFMGIPLAGVGDDARTPFVDVDTSRESYGAIRAMYDYGYISGDGTRYFNPEDAITVADAATVAVGILGYSFEALTRGGYPEGYITTAYSKEILTEKFAFSTSPMKLGNLYRMLYDMLSVPIMEREMTGTGENYSAKSGRTILSSTLKVEEYKGIVTANEYTSLTDSSANAGAGNISVDNKTYHTSQDFDRLLGMNVRYYVSYKNNSDGEIIYMTPEKNTITTINSDNIEEITSTRLSYTDDENGKRKNSVNMSPAIDVIYNGKAYTGYGILSNLKMDNGSVTFIDNNRDGKADVMDITEYSDYYIDGINTSDRIIYDYDRGASLSLNADENTVEIFGAEGNTARFSDIKKGTLISVAKSMGESDALIRVYVCEGVVEGKIGSISDDEYEIEGASYKKAPDFNKELTLHSEGIFLLDINGKIAALKTTIGDDYSYAIVHNCWIDDNGTDVGVRIFTEKEKLVSYTLKEKVVVDDKSTKINSKTAQTLIDTLKKGTVIRYRLNDDGSTISHIDIPLDMVEDISGNKYPADSEEYRTFFEGSSFKYRNGMMDGKVVVTDDTVIFSVPKSSDWSNRDAFGTLTTGAFTGGTSYSKNFKAYVIGENLVNIADVMVVEDMSKGAIGNGTNLVFVSNILRGVDEDGVEGYIISGVAGGNTVEYYCEGDELITEYGIKKADVLRIGVNSAGKVNSIQKIYNIDGSGEHGALLVPAEGVSENTSSFDSEFRVAVGTVEDIDSGYMRFSMTKQSGETLYEESAICRTEGAVVVRYDSSNRRNYTPVPCSVNDLLRGDTVLIRMNLATAKEIIIIR